MSKSDDNKMPSNKGAGKGGMSTRDKLFSKPVAQGGFGKSFPFEPAHESKGLFKFGYGESFIVPAKTNAQYNKTHADALEKAGKPRNQIGQRQIASERWLNKVTGKEMKSIAEVLNKTDPTGKALEQLQSEMRDRLRDYISCSEVGHTLVPLRECDKAAVAAGDKPKHGGSWHWAEGDDLDHVRKLYIEKILEKRSVSQLSGQQQLLQTHRPGAEFGAMQRDLTEEQVKELLDAKGGITEEMYFGALMKVTWNKVVRPGVF